MVQNEFPGDSISDRIIQEAVTHLEECWQESIDIADVARRLGIEPDTIRSIYPDQAALSEAIGHFGVARLADRLNRELIAAPADARGALMALAMGYLNWARDNPRLYNIITRPTEDNTVARRYDASFVPLIRRILGEPEGSQSHRLAIARSLISGVTQLTLAGHFELWIKSGSDFETELRTTVAETIDMLVAHQAEAEAQPIRSDA